MYDENINNGDKHSPGITPKEQWNGSDITPLLNTFVLTQLHIERIIASFH